jgi:hypothetical protein
MRFALVFHGPEVVDTGLAQRVMALLRSRGDVTAVMSGYTGVAAVIDAGLEAEVDISRRRKPSIELAKMSPEADLLVLVNSAKSRESALRFGSLVFSRCKDKLTRPLVQVDKGLIIGWTGGEDVIVHELAVKLDLEILPAPAAPIEEGLEWRKVGGVLPGESVWIDGTVVGKATSDQILIGKGSDHRLVAQGIALKETGVKRLGDFDVREAHIRSGMTRRTMASPRCVSSRKDGVFLIDHAAEDAIYKCRDAALVITVGDDTSKIAGALLYRFDVPVVAITDGDEDGISRDPVKARGSVVVRLRSGTDDLVGAEVKGAMFHGGDFLEGAMSPQQAAAIIIQIAGPHFLGSSQC